MKYEVCNACRKTYLRKIRDQLNSAITLWKQRISSQPRIQQKLEETSFLHEMRKRSLDQKPSNSFSSKNSISTDYSEEKESKRPKLMDFKDSIDMNSFNPRHELLLEEQLAQQGAP